MTIPQKRQEYRFPSVLRDFAVIVGQAVKPLQSAVFHLYRPAESAISFLRRTGYNMTTVTGVRQVFMPVRMRVTAEVRCIRPSQSCLVIAINTVFHMCAAAGGNNIDMRIGGI